MLLTVTIEETGYNRHNTRGKIFGAKVNVKAKYLDGCVSVLDNVPNVLILLNPVQRSFPCAAL